MTKIKSFGMSWTKEDIKFPSHLTPEIIHSALYIWNAGDDNIEDQEESRKRWAESEKD